MTPGQRLLGRLAAWTGVCAAPFVLGLPSHSREIMAGAGVPAGAAVGLVLYLGLAAWSLPLGGLKRARAPAVVARSGYLLARSAVEEVVWRGYAFAALALVLGTAPAFGATVAGFALAHRRVQGRLWLVHLLTGGAFTAVFVATGSLLAAIAAHGTYNVLVGLAIEGGRAPPVALPAATAELRQIVKRFGRVVALERFDLELREGETVALLGPNGAGKTTAVAVLLGLRRPDSGRACLFGRDPRDPAARRLLGAVPQEIGFPWSLRVREIVELVRAHYANPLPTADVLQRFALEPIAHRQAGGLSGGQKRRLAVALAFAGRPRLVVLDEPSAGLDVETRRAFWGQVRAHAADGGTALLTTHHLEEAEALASRIVVIDHGKLLLEGGAAEIRASVGLTRIRVRAGGLPPLPQAARVERHGDRYTIYTPDSDAVVGELVRCGVPFAELEVSPLSLEDAFLRLTGNAA